MMLRRWWRRLFPESPEVQEARERVAKDATTIRETRVRIETTATYLSDQARQNHISEAIEKLLRGSP
jgi:hypothetical protein